MARRRAAPRRRRRGPAHGRRRRELPERRAARHRRGRVRLRGVRRGRHAVAPRRGRRGPRPRARRRPLRCPRGAPLLVAGGGLRRAGRLRPRGAVAARGAVPRAPRLGALRLARRARRAPRDLRRDLRRAALRRAPEPGEERRADARAPQGPRPRERRPRRGARRARRAARPLRRPGAERRSSGALPPHGRGRLRRAGALRDVPPEFARVRLRVRRRALHAERERRGRAARLRGFRRQLARVLPDGRARRDGRRLEGGRVRHAAGPRPRRVDVPLPPLPRLRDPLRRPLRPRRLGRRPRRLRPGRRLRGRARGGPRGLHGDGRLQPAPQAQGLPRLVPALLGLRLRSGLRDLRLAAAREFGRRPRRPAVRARRAGAPRLRPRGLRRLGPVRLLEARLHDGKGARLHDGRRARRGPAPRRADVV